MEAVKQLAYSLDKYSKYWSEKRIVRQASQEGVSELLAE